MNEGRLCPRHSWLDTCRSPRRWGPPPGYSMLHRRQPENVFNTKKLEEIQTRSRKDSLMGLPSFSQTRSGNGMPMTMIQSIRTLLPSSTCNSGGMVLSTGASEINFLLIILGHLQSGLYPILRRKVVLIDLECRRY